MRVLFVASEIAPFAATGGLAEVARALPPALAAHGVDVIRVMPMYRHVMESGRPLQDTGIRLRIPVGLSTWTAEVWVCDDPAPSTYFIRRDEYFDRSQLYGLPDRDYDDNAERFVFFQKAVVALSDALQLAPDIVHGHDWQCGLLPLFFRYGIQGMGRGAVPKTVFTIHNLAYQGIFPGSAFSITHLPFACFSVSTMEFYGDVNSMKAGITTADLVTTVSPTYAQEIQTPELGCGLDGVLREHASKLLGIVHGVDYAEWDPAHDAHLPARYDATRLRSKAICRQALAREMGLKLEKGQPLLGMVSRLAEQKGLDILCDAVPELMGWGARMVVLGTGQRVYHERCEEFAKRYPEQFAFRCGYDVPLSHRIEAGADIFLMPSRFEPCGLNQLYSLRYGTIPVVHATGGLKDTIRDVDEHPEGNGFVFADYSMQGLLSAVRRALKAYQDRPRWVALMKRAMAEDHSWEAAAAAYIAAYERLLRPQG